MDSSPTALFEAYEQDFQQLIDSIRDKVDKDDTGDPVLIDRPEQRKTDLRRADMEVEEAEEMVSQMEIEIQGFPQSVRPPYQARLNNAKTQLQSYKKSVRELSAQHARSELLGKYSSSGLSTSDEPYGATDKTRLLSDMAVLEDGSRRLQESQRIALETEEQGADILRNLRGQREQIENARDTLEIITSSIEIDDTGRATVMPPSSVYDRIPQGIRLEIPEEWRFWSGWYPGGPELDWLLNTNAGEQDKWRVIMDDPVDEEGYDALASFPNLKPNIDVFNPPLQSRKLRGWYQVRSKSQKHAERPCLLVTAKSIPQEIFELILAQDTELRHDKRTLSQCGQVCRFWSTHCRPRLFERVHLRTRQDVLDFRSFIHNPTCLFLPYVKATLIQPDDLASFDWIHILSPLRDGCPFELWLAGPLPSRWKSFRSIHQAFPLPLPRNCSRNICTLHLRNIFFRRFTDLVALVVELPDLEKFQCEKVSWGLLPPALPQRRPTTSRNRLQEWEMKECGPCSVRAAFHLFASIYSASSYALDGDLPAIVALTNTFEIGALTESSHYYPAVDTAYLHFRSESIEVDLTIRRTSQLGASLWRLTTLGIGPLRGDLGDMSVDWAQFDSKMAEFRHLQIICLGFQKKQNMIVFAQETVERKMPVLSERGIVKYALKDDGGLWYHRATEEPNLLEGMFDDVIVRSFA
ncbi:hypothetical protein EIP86_009082 [Pleurotus ostreatoroseus]|nr:hypothetical protein EIP86_009082 [Pleurotus ostreatoroseus]